MGILDLANYVQQQGALGKEAGQKSRLAKLYSQALAAPEDQRDSYLPQMAAESPDAANAASGQFSTMRKQAYDDLGREAGMFVALAQSGDAATAQAAYTRLAQKAQAAGHPVPPTYDPKMLPMIQKLAGVTAGEGYTLTPGSRRYGPNGELIAEAPMAPPSQSVVNVPDGQGGTTQMLFDPKTGQFSQPQYPGQQQPPPTDSGVPVQAGAMLDPKKDYPQLAANFPGTQISSLLRTPQHNAEVGGVPDSQHMRGTAGDFVIPKPEQAAFIAKAKAMGYEVIPEGDHVHVELPRGRQAASTFAQGGRLGYTPPKATSDEPPKGYRWNADHTSMEAIPGGPAEVANAARADAAAAKKAAQDAAAGQKAQAAKARQAASIEAADQLVSSIDNLMQSPGFSKLGTMQGSLEVGVPYVRNDAKDADAQLHNIAGQVALATMSRLKALSSQGATGFGSLSGPELTLLQNSIATLRSDDISNDQLRKSLKIIRDTMAKVSGWNPQAATQAPPSGHVDDLLSKYGVK